jgi:hypothetical protein
MLKFILLFLLSFSVNASEIGVLVGCKHLDSKQPYNEKNPGIYIKSKSYTVGTYLNSFNHQATFAGKYWEAKYFSITVGAVYGYGVSKNGLTNDANGVAPLIVPSVHLPVGDVKINAHLLGNAVGLSIGYKF